MSSIVNTYSPVIHGRAPLLWVVLPGMAGVQLGTQEVVYPWLWLALAGVALAGLWSKVEGRGFHMILVLFALVLGMLYTSLRLGST
ncbi:MAG: hypothetical protein LR015_10665, partial [Verrucomicrobia bacterium]|nr:hypothetical protein [Verrucomicrobiota bacterium]